MNNKNNGNPHVKIIEQPLSRGARFRYECEGRYSGSIRGVNSTSRNKTYPSIEIVNHEGPAFVVVSCVTKDSPYRPHPNKLVGKGKDISQGICYFKIPANQKIISFSNLGIQYIKKKNVNESLVERERLKVDPYRTGFRHRHKPESIDLNCVRLCFQVFVEGQESGNFNLPLNPVVSNPIYDKKASAELAICWLSHASATASGGNIMCILCEKIFKDDVQVIFFDKEYGWEEIAELTSPFHHKQVAVIFKTPKYLKEDIDKPVTVYIQLKRLSDGEMSKPVPFQYLPLEVENYDSLRKKRQKVDETPKNLVFKHLQEESATINSATQRNCDIAKINPSDLPLPVAEAVNSKISAPSFYPQPNNQTNTFSNCASVLDSVPYNSQQNYDFEQMPLNLMEEIDYSFQNLESSQMPIYNNLITVQQKQCNEDKPNNDSQSIHRIENEPYKQHNSTNMDELLMSIIDEHFSNNLSISEEF